MMRLVFITAPIGALIGWAAVAAALAGDAWLAWSLIAASLFCMAAPWLFDDAEQDEPAADEQVLGDMVLQAGPQGPELA
ncbi:hypothetical protein [Sphingomonas morindae]|uniref:Uncharacterized protein n=1 Tax=Sphingomonas morindae TaxID=1541170 RepID=A0ABY4X459_9SPHN|nr:hypothetical protein [Sphingomonas morindae]USI71640.1 hypothetical protein LHA26_09860 [Sphingomonas morindae]